MRGRLLLCFFLLSAIGFTQTTPQAPPPSVAPQSLSIAELEIKKVDKAPTLDDFADMKPSAEWEGKLTRVPEFINRDPTDGAKPQMLTDVYMGYDEKNLYAIFVAWDPEPNKIRARLTRREAIGEDDTVQMLLDTFYDKRRAYSFLTNGRGIEWDRIWEEPGNTDDSFDTIWKADGRITDRGYLSLMAIPFRSLRFSTAPRQTWGIVLQRINQRINEVSFWPRNTSKIAGRMNQSAKLTGMENISPGRNIQFIPYGVFRAFRAIDSRDPAGPVFTGRRAEVDGGVDGKMVIKDAFVFDFTINPDFSQVESDSPQVTVNQRFEVFFPEKRPFFLENSDYFRTPLNLVFTRRIADPQFGVRLTGKKGPFSLGLLATDDQSPGKSVFNTSPLKDERALFGVVRMKYDLFKESHIGVIFTDREFNGDMSGPGSFFRTAFNRVGGIDGQFRLSPTWRFNFQAVATKTKFANGTSLAGPGYELNFFRNGHKFNYFAGYSDRAPGFRTQTGFVSRVDVRVGEQQIGYRWRPEGKRLIAHGPEFFQAVVYGHDGVRLDWSSYNDYRFQFKGQTTVGVLYNFFRERIRPQDFGPPMTSSIDFSRREYGFFVYSGYLKWITLDAIWRWNHRINFVPVAGNPPELGNGKNGGVFLTVRPLDQLVIENSYQYATLTSRVNGANIFNNHILRSKVNYQFTKALSLRFITQYDAVLANRSNTSLDDEKALNFDILATYLLNPGTAIYVGYNSNLSNVDRALALNPVNGNLLRTRDPFTNDGKQFFVKASYLFRF